MSLRDMGVYNPLKPDHHLIEGGEKCHYCEVPFAAGTRTALVPWETTEQTGSLTVEARVVCATCKMRGIEITTPVGRRIVQRIKDGDASSFPVVTTDGKQWRDEEVKP